MFVLVDVVPSSLELESPSGSGYSGTSLIRNSSYERGTPVPANTPAPPRRGPLTVPLLVNTPLVNMRILSQLQVGVGRASAPPPTTLGDVKVVNVTIHPVTGNDATRLPLLSSCYES